MRLAPMVEGRAKLQAEDLLERDKVLRPVLNLRELGLIEAHSVVVYQEVRDILFGVEKWLHHVEVDTDLLFAGKRGVECLAVESRLGSANSIGNVLSVVLHTEVDAVKKRDQFAELVSFIVAYLWYCRRYEELQLRLSFENANAFKKFFEEETRLTTQEEHVVELVSVLGNRLGNSKDVGFRDTDTVVSGVDTVGALIVACTREVHVDRIIRPVAAVQLHDLLLLHSVYDRFI